MSRWVVVCAALFFAACSVDPAERPEPQIQTEAATRATVGEDGHTYEVVTVGNTKLTLVDGTTYMMADDIVLAPWQVDFLRQEAVTKEEKAQTRAAVSTELVKYWHNATVYYTIASNFTKPQRVTDAIAHYHNNTFINFVPRTNQSNYIEFGNNSNPNFSYSSLGMTGGKQVIKMAAGAPAGDVIHEIGHALGLFHEQNRRDRDEYVTILWDKILNEDKPQFEIDNYTFDIGEFDFESVMIYHSWSFPKIEGDITMTKKNGATFFDNSVLSEGDIDALRVMYFPDPSPVYIKMVSQHDASQSWSEYSYTYERWYTVYDNWIEFYSDPQRTNRIALPDALRVFEIVRVENSNGVGPYQKLYISPGTWQYTLHDSVEDAEFSYGATTYFTYLSYRNLRIVSDNI